MVKKETQRELFFFKIVSAKLLKLKWTLQERPEKFISIDKFLLSWTGSEVEVYTYIHYTYVVTDW